jgi:hypothetical protein
MVHWCTPPIPTLSENQIITNRDYYAHFLQFLRVPKIEQIDNGDLQHFFLARYGYAQFLSTYFTVIVKHDMYHED